MIPRWLQSLLDLQSIPDDAPDIHIIWEHPWPAWLWVMFLLAAGILAAWSYRRLDGRGAWGVVLAGLRLLLLLLLLILLSGPALQVPRETVEPDSVALLLDRSASMTIGDVEIAGRRMTRDEQLKTIIKRHSTLWPALARQRRLHWVAFASGTRRLLAGTSGGEVMPPDIPQPGRDGTDLDNALRHALDRAPAPLSGIVLFSDGRTTRPPNPMLRRRLTADAVPVFVVPLGAPTPPGDIALARVDAPRRAFIRDRIPLNVCLRRTGAAIDHPCAIELVDEMTGRTLHRRDVLPGENERLTLVAEPTLPGEAVWRVVLHTTEPDLIPENNAASVSITLVDRPIRLLYVDGYPRWEYRYLKNLLIRERSVECSVMLLSADADFAQEGDRPLTRLPRTVDEIADYDLIILGDVPASFLSSRQRQLIRDHVGNRGAGLLWIAGSRYTPSSFARTALADLLPVRGSLNLPPIPQPVNLQPTDAARRLGVLHMTAADSDAWPAELSDPSYAWSQLQYAQRIDPAQLKPTAEILAETVQRFGDAPLPLVVNLRYGAGQSTYVATDEIWRWRYGRGEHLVDKFWIPLIRMLARAALSGADGGAVVGVEPRYAEIGRPVLITLRFLDEKLSAAAPASVIVRIEADDATPLAELRTRRTPDAEGCFAATWVPDRPGDYVIRVTDPMLEDASLTSTLHVVDPNDELRWPEADHELLRQLAAATGGRVLAPHELADLPELLPNRSLRILNPIRESIWDTPLAFALVLALLTAEWIGRKILRLA